MDISKLAQDVQAGNRRALARAITLVESQRADHRDMAADLLGQLRGAKQALRIGLSGTPGVGKSTFIETFGLMLVEVGLKVAVLAVDPSSARSGGSILGDKTRMELLSRAPSAFIRPSPSQTHLGGVARRSREAVALCEAAGFDVVLIETVGVGQSETMVAQMCDLFLLLLAPAGGDELQGVKRGIMEIADIILVNKADGELKSQAMRTRADYAGALRLLRKRPQDPDGFPVALAVSAETGDGIAKAWENMQYLTEWRRTSGVWDDTRIAQARHWFRDELRLAMLDQIPDGSNRLEEDVAAGRVSIAQAVTHAMAPAAVRDIVTYRVRADQADGFAAMMRDAAVPLYAAHGIDVDHAGPSVEDPASYVVIRRFASMDAMTAQLDRLHADAAWAQDLAPRIDQAILQTQRVVVGVD